MVHKEKLSSKELKRLKVKQYEEWLKNANAVILFDSLLPASEVWPVKKKLAEKGATYHVVKNRLFSRALNALYGTQPTIKGFTGAIFCSNDPIEPVKIIWELVKNNKLIIKFGYYNKEEIDSKKIEELANIPSYNELIGKLSYLIVYPIKGLLYIVQAPIKNFLITLSAVKEVKATKV